MTQDINFNIESVAIIGSGAAGLTTLFELLHTTKSGSTTISYKENGELDLSKLANDDPAFKKIFAFEQNSKVGGIWTPSFDHPDIISQELFDSQNYDDPYVLKPKTPSPKDLESQEYSFGNQFVTKNNGSKPTWANSGIYKHLYSNVPSRYLRNSFIPYEEQRGLKYTTKALLDPLITNFEITRRLLNFTDQFQLEKHVRVNSEVVDISKTSDGVKWKITVKETSGSHENINWYTEIFDAVIVSTGHYSVPYVPSLKGLSSWNAQFESSVFHSKSFRDPQIFKDKVCLFVGTGLSGLDILQYAFPIAKSVIVSRTVGKKEIYKWLTKAATSDGIIVKPRIKELKPLEGKRVVFEDESSVDSVDLIIFSTGYHWHYPFLSDKDTNITVSTGEKRKPDGSSMVKGLYLNTFAIKDPSLAFVGVTLTPFKWPSFELTASAIAGVWTNHAKLPAKEDQIRYVFQRIQKTGGNILYHYYPPENFSEYVDELVRYLPEGRSSAHIYDTKHLDDVNLSFANAEKLFYQLKSGKVLINDTL